MSLRDLPKVELHLHLEGAAPASFIRGLAREKNIDISKIFTEEGGYAFRDFGHFLQVYEAACTTLQSPEDFARLTRAVLEESASHGVLYSEAFVSPDFCGGGDVAAWRDYLAAIQGSAEEAERDFGITLRGIVTCIRHLGPDVAKKAALCAAETASDWLVGFGMGGDENAGEQKDFAYSFDMAREAGLKLTTHAGEWRGPSEVAAAIDHLRVERIGHGVRAAEDPRLMERLAEMGVVLELCPISNITLGVFPNMEAYPIEMLMREGVQVTVSTDDPPFFHTTMTREFEALAQTFKWDDGAFSTVTQTALDAAFCDEATRSRIAARLKEAAP